VPFPRSGMAIRPVESGSKKDKGKRRRTKTCKHQNIYAEDTQALHSKGAGSKSLRPSDREVAVGDALQGSKPKQDVVGPKIWTGESVQQEARVSLLVLFVYITCRETRPFCEHLPGHLELAPEQVRTVLAVSPNKQHVVVASPTEYTQLQSSQARTFVVGSSSGIVMPNAAPNTRLAKRLCGTTAKHCRCQQHRPAYGLWGRRRRSERGRTAHRRAPRVELGPRDTEADGARQRAERGTDLNEQEMNVGAAGLRGRDIVPPVNAAEVLWRRRRVRRRRGEGDVNSRRLSVTPLAVAVEVERWLVLLRSCCFC